MNLSFQLYVSITETNKNHKGNDTMTVYMRHKFDNYSNLKSSISESLNKHPRLFFGGGNCEHPNNYYSLYPNLIVPYDFLCIFKLQKK